MISYFFIPADNQIFLSKKSTINANEFIVDFEDSINQENLILYLENLIKYKIPKNTWIRIVNPIQSKNINKDLFIKKILKYGFTNFIIPKIRSVKERDLIFNKFDSFKLNKKSLKFILLIENPSALINLYNICNSKLVYGIGVGSHDYCADINMEHTLSNILFLRMSILNVAKALELKVIDFASMNIKMESSFKKECLDSKSKGFDAKFLIHPWQLNIFNNSNLYTNEDIIFAKKVDDHIKNIGGIDKFKIIKIDGRIIERLHLPNILKIINKIKK